jgi:hypothetical protein
MLGERPSVAASKPSHRAPGTVRPGYCSAGGQGPAVDPRAQRADIGLAIGTHRRVPLTGTELVSRGGRVGHALVANPLAGHIDSEVGLGAG